MSSMMEDLAGKDPRRAAELLLQATPHIQRRRKFLESLEAEKGRDHALLASIMMKVYSVSGMLAMLAGGLSAGRFSTEEERMLAFSGILDVLSLVMTDTATKLGLNQAEFSELEDAARQYVDSIVMPSLAGSTPEASMP